MSAPIAAPIAPQMGTDLDGPLDVDGGADQADGGDSANGDVHQLTWHSAWTGEDDRGVQCSPTTVAAVTTVDSRDVESNAFALALLLAEGGAGAVAVPCPIVTPFAPQPGTNVNVGDVHQLSWQSAWAGVDDRDAQSHGVALGHHAGAGAVAVSGPIVVPVSGQLNWDSSWSWVDSGGAQSAAVSGPIVAAVNPQAGTNVNGSLNVNGSSDRHESGILGDVHQLNWNWSWTWLDDYGAQSDVGAPIVPVAVAGPDNANEMLTNLSSGAGPDGLAGLVIAAVAAPGRSCLRSPASRARCACAPRVAPRSTARPRRGRARGRSAGGRGPGARCAGAGLHAARGPRQLEGRMTKRVLATVIVLAFAIGSAAIVAPLFFLRPEAKQASTLASTSMSTPVRMRIPAIGVDAPIRPVAADAAGGLAIPVDPSWIAWYSPGVRPGEAGDAVLAGRLDASGNSALARLAQLPTGSPIEVLLADGSTLTFDVASAQGYAGNRQPAGLFGRGGLPRISLVASGTARFVVEATLRRIAVPLPSGRFEQH